ncbi:hypothetical protein NM688_g3518 [Phlebia brevispora]|uniref:Uncharacterized protein n=1 Tax=Phlebia brevispora TaxID=194682 RepID=A0ACC1T5N1_9APHY|nr:hypothetical protein NM688_g3518 [Phlebia brevispora]
MRNPGGAFSVRFSGRHDPGSKEPDDMTGRPRAYHAHIDVHVCARLVIDHYPNVEVSYSHITGQFMQRSLEFNRGTVLGLPGGSRGMDGSHRGRFHTDDLSRLMIVLSISFPALAAIRMTMWLWDALFPVSQLASVLLAPSTQTRKVGVMSATADIAKVRGAYKADLIYNYSEYSSLTMVCYEFVITFQYEYELVWKREWTAATWLFLTSRYLALGCAIIGIVPYSAPTYDIHTGLTIHGLIHLLAGMFLLFRELNDPQLMTSAFSALRVSALLRSVHITAAAVTFSLGVTPLGLNLYRISQTTPHYVDDPVLGSSCYYIYTISPAVVFQVLFTINMLYGLILLVVCLDVRNLATMLMRRWTSFKPSLELFDPANTFLSILPNIVLVRFLIRLRQINSIQADSAAHRSLSSASDFHTFALSSIIGNLSELLADDDDDDEQDGNSGECVIRAGDSRVEVP